MRRLFSLLAVVLVVGAPGAAFAHSDVETTTPADGEHVADPPAEVRITFKQPPTADSRFEVVDGCDEDVLAQIGGDGRDVVLQVAPGGSTGAWTVRYRVISATDGHLVRGDLSFLVGRGPLRCGEEAPDGDETPEVAPSTPDGGVATDDGDGGDFPIMPVVIGGGVIVALAVAVRMMSAR